MKNSNTIAEKIIEKDRDDVKYGKKSISKWKIDIKHGEIYKKIEMVVSIAGWWFQGQG